MRYLIFTEAVRRDGTHMQISPDKRIDIDKELYASDALER